MWVTPSDIEDIAGYNRKTLNAKTSRDPQNAYDPFLVTVSKSVV